MNKEVVICIACAVLGIGGWFGTKFYKSQQVAEAVRIEQVRKSAYAQAMDQARAEAKKITEQRVKDGVLPDAAMPGAARKPGAAPAAGAAAATTPAPADSPEVKTFLATAKITSILLGAPNLAIIDKKSYEEGGELALPGGGKLTIARITDDGVTFSAPGGKSYLLGRR